MDCVLLRNDINHKKSQKNNNAYNFSKLDNFIVENSRKIETKESQIKKAQQTTI